MGKDMIPISRDRRTPHRTRWKRRAAIGCLALLFAAISLSAQQIQIPVDEDARLERITPDVEKGIKLFEEYAGFQQARLFMLPDSTYLLEVEYLSGGALLRAEKPLDRDELKAFRAEISRRLKARMPETLVDREGRAAFLITTTGLSLSMYGWLLPSALGIENDKKYAGVYLLTAGGGFILPYFLTKESRISDGMATLAFQGGVRGLIDGYFLSRLLGVDGDREKYGFALGMSVCELLAGYEIARAADLNTGETGAISVAGNFGMGLGIAGAVIADENAMNSENRAGPLGALLGSAAGYAAGVMLSRSANYTPGDADVLSTAGVLGAGWGLTFCSYAETDAPASYAWLLSIGALGGLTTGHLLQQARDFTSSQGRFLQAGTALGALGGLGFSVMIAAGSKSGEDAGKIILTGTLIGATAAYGLLLSAYAPEAEAAARSSSWRVQFSPAGLAAILLQGGQAPAVPVPLLVVSNRF